MKSSTKQVYDVIINDIKKRNLAIFCGAGISLNPPSFLPSSKLLRKSLTLHLFTEVLDSLPDKRRKYLLNGENDLKKEDIIEYFNTMEKPIIESQINELYKRQLERNPYYQFEKYIQEVNRYVDILSLLEKIYTYGNPNKNHFFISYLMKYGYVNNVMTTNFDIKIEEAVNYINNIDYTSKINLKIYSKEEQFENFNIMSENNHMSLFKLHGSIDNIGSIRTTLDLLTMKRLLNARKIVLNYFFDYIKKNIFMFGYSCSDHYDINPTIELISPNNKIYIIRGYKKGNKESPGIYSLEDPFSKFEGYKIVVADYNEPINYIWNKLFNFKEPIIQKNSVDWNNVVNKWMNNIEAGDKYYGASCILDNFSEYELSLKMALKGYRIYQSSNNKLGMAVSLNHIGGLHLEKNNIDKAEKCFLNSMKLKKQLARKDKLPTTLFNLSLLYKKKGDLKNAEKYARECYKLSYQLQNIKGMIKSLTLLIDYLKEQGKIMDIEKEYYELIEVCNIMGYLELKTSILTSLGDFYAEIDNPEKSVECYDYAMQISKGLGNVPLEISPFLGKTSLDLKKNIAGALEILDQIMKENKNPGKDY